jgi:para-nitrobenzyl esterase
MLLTRRAALRAFAGVAAVSAVGCAVRHSGGEAVVRLRQGRLEGVALDGATSWKNIPYAAPPVGPLRFRPPEAAPSWSGVRPAAEFGPMAMQVAPQGAPLVSEDCLTLNVWAPTTRGPHPVFVFIHGGANSGGSPQSATFDGAAFARSGVVCVTIQYRVGTWGFLELGGVLQDYAGSGVNGLRDQIAALAWVRDNIADFGGDPERVTVGGHSAGAKDVCALLAAPDAAGLFASAISESGGGHTVHTAEEAAEMAEMFFAAPSFEGRGPEAILSMPPDELIVTQRDTVDRYRRNAAFRPVVDGDVLRAKPVDVIAAGASRSVRLLIGTVRDESAAYLAGRTRQSPIEAVELSNVSLADGQAVYERYLETYAQDDPLQRRVRFMTAEEYWGPTMRVVNGRVGQTEAAEMFVYRFDLPNAAGALAGWASHGVDAPFAFGTVPREAAVPPGAAALGFHDRWAAFIKGEAPGADWPRFTAADRRILRLAETADAVPPDDAQLALWDGVL